MSARNRLLGGGTVALLALGGAYMLSPFAFAQGGATVVTQVQVVAGKAGYAGACAGCHRANLVGGGDAPALGGAGFMASWGNRSTKEFYQFIASSMPAGAPGSLSEKAYTDITAYLLAANGAKIGATAYSKNTDFKVSTIANGKMPADFDKITAASAATARAGGTTPLNRRSDLMAPAFQLGHTVKGTVKNYVDVTDDMLRHPPDGEWLMYRRNYQGWSFSPLNQINAGNVNILYLKWSFIMYEVGF
jgi:alcohol dehydrogenase (cytochrome c)